MNGFLGTPNDLDNQTNTVSEKKYINFHYISFWEKNTISMEIHQSNGPVSAVWLVFWTQVYPMLLQFI